MVLTPVSIADPNTAGFESLPLIRPEGFLERDLLWWFGFPGSDRKPDINLLGAQALGMGFATMMRRSGATCEIVTGHDFRSYSLSFKLAFVSGLMAAGANVKDVGLAIAPLICHAQSVLDVSHAAFVSGQHHENGWIGVKLGVNRNLTIGSEALGSLRDIVLSADFDLGGGGSFDSIAGLRESYLASLIQGAPLTRPLKIVVATANGTAGLFAPQAIESSGCQVIGLDTELDYTFPHGNPDPENTAWLHAIGRKIVETRADVGFAFGGAGDHCTVVANDGRPVNPAQASLLLAREMAARRHGSAFIVDRSWQILFDADSVLRRHAALTYGRDPTHGDDRMEEHAAVASFESSGRIVFCPPFGLGREDGLLTALIICRAMDSNPNATISDLCRMLPSGSASASETALRADEFKYYVVEHMRQYFHTVVESGQMVAGHKIAELQSVNGMKIVMTDGTWAQIRASSGHDELTVRVESPVSDARRHAVFEVIDTLLRSFSNAGSYSEQS